MVSIRGSVKATGKGAITLNFAPGPGGKGQ